MKKTLAKNIVRVAPLLLVFAGVFSMAHAADFGQYGSTTYTILSGVGGSSMNSNASTSPFNGEITQLKYYFTAVVNPPFTEIDVEIVNQTVGGYLCDVEIPYTGDGLQVVTNFGNYLGVNCSTVNLVAGDSYTVQIQGTPTSPISQFSSLGASTATGDVYWDISNSPLGDGNTNTHVIRITRPVLYATTTTPTAVDFDIYDNSTNEANGYKITYQNASTSAITSVYGFLTDSGWSSADDNQPFTVSTTSPSLANGKYTMNVVLDIADRTQPLPTATNPSSFFYPAATTYFGVGTGVSFVLTPTFTSSFFSYSSTSCAINFSGSFSLSDCLGYIFLPSQNWAQSYYALGQQFQTVFPFSYPASIASTWNALQASSTANAPVYNFNFASLGIGSTTAMGNILPNVEAFGSTTVTAYMPAGTLPTILSIEAIVLWLGFGADVFFTVRNMLHS